MCVLNVECMGYLRGTYKLHTLFHTNVVAIATANCVWHCKNFARTEQMMFLHRNELGIAVQCRGFRVS